MPLSNSTSFFVSGALSNQVSFSVSGALSNALIFFVVKPLIPNVRRIYIDRSNSFVPTEQQYTGESMIYTWDFAREERVRGASLVSIQYSNTGVGEIEHQYINDSFASVQYYGREPGKAVIKCEALFSNATIRVKHLKVDVISVSGDFYDYR